MKIDKNAVAKFIGGKKKQRTVCFTDVIWEDIQEAAHKHKTSTAKFLEALFQAYQEWQKEVEDK